MVFTLIDHTGRRFQIQDDTMTTLPPLIKHKEAFYLLSAAGNYVYVTPIYVADTAKIMRED